MKEVLVAFILLFVCYGVFESALLGYRLHRGMRIAEQSEPFESKFPNASKRILVVGDSTGVGTGADHPGDSIAGRIFSEYDDVEIVNLAKNGAKAEDVLGQLKTVYDKNFLIVLVQIGGNDILRFTDLEKLRRIINDVLALSVKKGRHVIFMSTGNVGLAPAFFPPISWIYTYRTRSVRPIFMRAASIAGAEYVDLFKEKGDDPFLKNPDKFYAADYLHPGSHGYGLWFEELKKQTSFTEILAEEK